jgi:hypothetical protein
MQQEYVLVLFVFYSFFSFDYLIAYENNKSLSAKLITSDLPFG